ncbi:MAG: hypothetical protein AAGA60_24890 [Cyanobacteria bacterium P01_E01_bin.42]
MVNFEPIAFCCDRVIIGLASSLRSTYSTASITGLIIYPKLGIEKKRSLRS